MGRYAHLNDVLDDLRSVDIEAFSVGDEGTSTAKRDALLESLLQQGEAWCDGFMQRIATPLHRHVEVVSGLGTVQLQVRHAPIYDVLEVAVRYDPLAIAHTFSAAALRVQKQDGIVGIKPSFAVQGAWPLGLANAYQYVFARGVNNIVVQYRTGFAVVGDNVGTSVLADSDWYDVATVTTDASYAYFTTPQPFSPWKAETLLNASTFGQNRMLKDGADNSAQWTMLSNTQLRCPLANYSAAAVFVFVYVPQAIGEAAVDVAMAHALMHKAEKDYRGSAGGALKLTMQGFTEDYGTEFQYAGTVRERQEHAKELLRPFRRMLIV